MIRMAELCAGYGGLGMAMRLAGWPVELAWYAENDSDASKMLAAHHPGVPNVGDITVAQFSAQEPVDVLAAGFPCQPVSGAGRQLGSADERWLWPDVARAVRVLRPPVFVGENVMRLLSIDRGALYGGILADLDELGYTVRWTTVGACRMGLCHHRHRVFIVATRDGLVSEPERWPVARRDGTEWTTAADTLFGDGALPQWPDGGVVSGGTVWAEPAWPCGADGIVEPAPTATPLAGVQMLPTPGARIADKRGTPSRETAERRIHEQGRRNLEDAVALLPTPRVSATRTGRSAILGSSSAPSLDQALEIAAGMLPRELQSWDEAPQSWLPTPRARDGKGRDPNPRGVDLNEAVGQLLPTPMAADGGTDRASSAGNGLRNVAREIAAGLLPTPRATDGVKGGPNQRGSSGDLALPAAVQPGRFGPYEAAVRRHELVTGRPAPEPTEPGQNGKPRLAPAFPEFMQALPPGWVTDHVGRGAALRLIGNGIAVPAAAYALTLLLPAGPVRPELATIGGGS